MAKYMQRIGVVGALVTVLVVASNNKAELGVRLFSGGVEAAVVSYVLPLLTVLSIGYCAVLKDWWALASLSLLMVARLVNVVVIRRRAVPGWHGVAEPGVEGDLLVLMSQDRWVRLRGLVDDLKAVTSGSWLQKMSTMESIVVSIATAIVYLAGAFALCSNFHGCLVIITLLLVSAGLLSWANGRAKDMRMHGRVIRVVGEPKRYKQRREMADELIKEHGRDDWAIGLGMIVPDHDRVKKAMM